MNASIGYTSFESPFNLHERKKTGFVLLIKKSYTPFEKAIKHNTVIKKDFEELLDVLSS